MNKNQKFREIEKIIDNHVNNHTFFKRDRNFAILSLLYQNELMGRYENISGFSESSKKLSIPVHVNIQFRRAIERALYFVFNKCPLKKKLKRKNVYDMLL